MLGDRNRISESSLRGEERSWAGGGDAETKTHLTAGACRVVAVTGDLGGS